MASNSKASLLGISATARLLNLSVDYVRELADSGKLPSERDSENRRVFRTVDVAALMRQRKKQPASERNDISKLDATLGKSKR